ncbi:MAG: glycoside hydrolase, partial [Planctomycetia bacterium]|nr:glycoside hydrolase [Planctomycetia bacterium]
YEGMMSMGWYMVESDAKTLEHFDDDPPANVIKYSIGENYRLPLWELVYHDCTVAYNWWYDFNNVRSKIWKKRDLFNVLYATPPMYRFDDKFWKAHKNEIADSYRLAQKTSLIAGGVEMLDHRFLTPDRKVQQTTFANGVVVTVNFGDKPWQGPDGTTLAPMSSTYTQKTSR